MSFNSTDKEKVITNLLGDGNPSTRKKGSLIEEINLEDSSRTLLSSSEEQIAPSSNNDGPSLLEIMMEAQRAASKEKEKEKVIIQAKEAKKSFSGFKKGFFGEKREDKIKTETVPSFSTGKALKADIVDLKPTEPKQNLAAKTKAPVLPDVQTALKEEENERVTSMLTQNKEWMTNDLMSQFQSNKVLARGFQNPKCVAAMKLLQSNPQEALERFKHDEEVSVFLKEFGQVMSGHFISLAEQQQQQKEVEQKTSSSVIQEIGPLQAQALKSARKEERSQTKTEPLQGSEEEERVKKILEDKELRELLMDSELQKVLLECSNQERFRYYMSQPDVASKIRKLQKAGLAQVEL